MATPLLPLVAPDGCAPLRRPQHRMLGEMLVASGGLAREALDAALARQQVLDAPLGRILRVDGAVSEADLHAALAEQAQLPLVDLLESPPESEILTGLDPYLCLELEALPWRQMGGTRIVAVASPANADAAKEAFGAGAAHRTAVVLAPGEQIRQAITARFAAELRDGARLRCPPAYSCRSMIARGARLRGAAVLSVLAAAVVVAPALMLQALMVWVLAMNVLTTGLRVFALAARARSGRRIISPEVADISHFKRLPAVSLLVPLKGEVAVAGNLIRALKELDYPHALLDIKLILEEADFATRAALERARLPAWFEILTVPRDGTLQTKPRAMNFALPYCRGSIIGVYDAEDRPDPAQIRAVVRALGEAPPEVACVQGYLDFYNPTDNWLARCFTIEYAIWFRVVLQGVERLGIPIPLGGTTVFFRRRALEQIGAWDAHNVTEDADLGMRLARFGFRCEMIRTVTLEEANCQVRPWLRQRARWLKGYAITWLTHMRAPGRLLRDLGPKGFVGFQVLFLGGLTSYLSMPLFWALILASAGFGLGVWDQVPPILFWSFIATTAAGQAAMLVIGATALADAGRKRMLPWLVTLILYWPLGAIAAYRAIAEMLVAPFHWHKTEHGFAYEAPVGRRSHGEPAGLPTLGSA